MERPTLVARPERPEPTIRRRRRPALSCRECRRRKIKCDHNKPCAHCIHHGTQCVYKPFVHDEPAAGRKVAELHQGGSGSRSPRAQPPSQSQSRLTTASPPLAVCASPLPSALTRATAEDLVTPTQTTLIPVSIGHANLQQSLPDQGAPKDAPALGDLLRRIQKLESSSVSQIVTSGSPTLNALSEASRDREPLPSQHQTSGPQHEWQAVLNKPRDLGRSRWMDGIPEFKVIMACYSEIMGRDSKNVAFHTPEAGALISEAGALLWKCKIRAKSMKSDRPTRGPTSPESSFMLPLRETADAQAKLYFTAFESAYVYLCVWD